MRLRERPDEPHRRDGTAPPGRAFLVGVAAGAAISLAVWALRSEQAWPIGPELILGTLTGLSPGRGTFTIGLVMHLVISGVTGELYAFVLTHAARTGAVAGAFLAIPHLLFDGSVLELVPDLHPRIPEVLPAPGAFAVSLGHTAVAGFVASHVIFGMLVGAYGVGSGEARDAAS